MTERRIKLPPTNVNSNTTSPQGTLWDTSSQPYTHTIVAPHASGHHGYGTYQPTYIPQQHIPVQTLGPMEGLDELCLLLGVEPATEQTGLLLSGESGKVYNLVAIVSAQLNIMTKLQVLLVHRDLTGGLTHSQESQ